MRLLSQAEISANLLQRSGSHRGLDTNQNSDLIIAEYLRGHLCRQATDQNTSVASKPVYISALLNHVRRQLRPVLPEVEIVDHMGSLAAPDKIDGNNALDPVRRVLDELQVIRDVAEVGNGYWLPSSTRFVALHGNQVLVVSGYASHDLYQLLGITIHHNGIARTCAKTEIPEWFLNDQTWWQSQDRWQGLEPSLSLAQWTSEYLVRARINLRQSASDLTDVEVYVPAERPRRAQYHRWVRIEELKRTPEGLVLCRSILAPRRPRNYTLSIIVRSGAALYMQQEFDIANADVRRLQYGFDLIAKASVTGRLRPDQGGYEMTLNSYLPAEEQRLLMVAAEPRTQPPGRLPLRYFVRQENLTTVQSALEALGIQFK